MKCKKCLVVAASAALIVLIVLFAMYVCEVLLPARAMKNAAPTVPHHAVAAHRGASYLAPEETEAAYILARDLGANYLELDVQRTKDHVLVAIHDDTVERTTNAAQVFPGREKNNVEDFTLAELKQLDAGSWFNKAFPERARPSYVGLKVLTIEEIIAIAESGTNKPALYMELKSPALHPGYERELVDLLKRHNRFGTFADGVSKTLFQSFSIDSLRQLKQLVPEAPRSYLIDEGMYKKTGWNSLVEAARADCQVMGPVGFVAWPWNVAKAHRVGLHVHVYTIDSTALFRLFTLFGVDGFFTNRCDLLMRYYGRALGAPPEQILAQHGY